GADDAGLGQRRVDDPVIAEVLLQTVGDPEDAAELADVLAHDDDLGVVLQGAAQAGVEGLAQGQCLGHQFALPSNDAWYRSNQARSASTSTEPVGNTLSNIVTGSG